MDNTSDAKVQECINEIIGLSKRCFDYKFEHNRDINYFIRDDAPCNMIKNKYSNDVIKCTPHFLLT